MMNWLLELDQEILLAINGLHTSWLDFMMHWISNKFVWIPVYAVLLWGIYKQYGWKRGLLIAALAGPLILIADQGASGILKPLVERPRPCHDPEIGYLVHRVMNKCGGPYGFVSSHAANFFALATYLGFFFVGRWSWYPRIFLIVAFVVACSRIYLGVHYPGDVLFGGILGVLAGLLMRLAYRRSEVFLKDYLT